MKIAERKILYAMEPGMKISRASGHLHCYEQKQKQSIQIPLSYLCGLVVSEMVSISPAVLVGAARNGIPVTFVANNGTVSGIFTPLQSNRSELRWKQLCLVHSFSGKLKMAKFVVDRKIASCRKIVRNWGTHSDNKKVRMTAHVLCSMQKRARQAKSLNELRGYEGEAARFYWQLFSALAGDTYFAGRSKNPPTTPANALLSFGYTVLSHQLAAAAITNDLDLSTAFLHEDSFHYRTLPWDLVELLRAYYVDRIVLSGIHRRRYKSEDFDLLENGACIMRPHLKKIFLADIQKSLSENNSFFKEKIDTAVQDYISAIEEFFDSECR